MLVGIVCSKSMKNNAIELPTANLHMNALEFVENFLVILIQIDKDR